ncbi:MAG: radical SAM protein [Planctomycetota bacterium]
MYPLKPAKLYADEKALTDPLCIRRMERLLSAMGCSRDQVVKIGDADLPETIRSNGLHSGHKRTYQLPEDHEPIVYFNALDLSDSDGKARSDAVLKQCPQGTAAALVRRLLGYDYIGHAATMIRSRELICRRSYEFQTAYGCLHRCIYCECAAEPVVMFALNIEDMIKRKIAPLLEANPWLKVFRYQTQVSDAPTFEPEYDAVRAFAEFFATTPDRYLLLHTKSANTDWLAKVAHEGRTIVCWSLTSDTVSRDIEKRTGATEERIEAARRCQEAGVPIRFKFKPIVPVKGWREEARRMIRLAFKRTQPDIVSLCVMMWMKAEEFEQIFDPANFDEEFVRAMRQDATLLKERQCGPFPHRVRAEIYNFYIDEIRKVAPDVPISLSTETSEMWETLGEKLGFGPYNYVCGCGPQCTPGAKVLGKDAQPVEAAV